MAGIARRGWHRRLAMAAGVLLTVTAWLINRALGVPVHPWREPAAARGQQAGVRGRGGQR